MNRYSSFRSSRFDPRDSSTHARDYDHLQEEDDLLIEPLSRPSTARPAVQHVGVAVHPIERRVAELSGRDLAFVTDVLRKGARFGLSQRQRACLDDKLRGLDARATAASPMPPAAPAKSYTQILALFAKSDHQSPRLTLADRDGGPVRLKIARSGAHVGSVHVSAGAYGTAYYGRIGLDGSFTRARACTPVVVALLDEIETDASTALARIGRATGVCCCCGRELTDPVSVANGIGPICAEKWGL